MLSFCTCCCLDCLLLNGLPQHSRTFLQICVLYIIVYKYMYIIHNMSIPQIGIHIHWKSLTYIIIFMIIYIIYIYYLYLLPCRMLVPTDFGSRWTSFVCRMVTTILIRWNPSFQHIYTYIIMYVVSLCTDTIVCPRVQWPNHVQIS